MNDTTFVLHNLKKYNEPKITDTCVALCYFNPIGYKNPKENLKIVLDIYEQSKIPYFLIELVYPNQQPSINKATKVVHANTITFSKENLWNLLEKEIPDQYSKIIFIDADIKFSNPNWFNLCSEKLDNYDIIQPMDVVYRDLENKYTEYIEVPIQNCTYSVAHMIELTGKASSVEHHPGYGIGIRREIFHKINGFFEYGFCGNGDTLFWMSISNFYSYSAGDFLLTRKDIAKKYYKYKINAINYTIKIGAVFDNMSIHLFHGTLKDRKYVDRTRYAIKNNQTDNFYHNEDGVLEMKNDDSIYQYLLDREEDSDQNTE